MNSLVGTTSRILRILVALNLSISPLVLASPAESGDIAKDLVSIRELGPEAVKFKVWTNREEGRAFHPGDRAIIYLSSDRPAYVTLLAIAADGVVTVLLPNRHIQDTMIQPNKPYALFGDDSPVRLAAGEMPSKDKLVVYLSPTPLVLDPLTIPKGRALLTLTGEAKKEINILKEKLQRIASEKGFNRATVILRGEAGNSLAINPTEAPFQSTKKGLSSGPESSIPETLTGSSGLKPIRENEPKP